MIRDYFEISMTMTIIGDRVFTILVYKINSRRIEKYMSCRERMLSLIGK